MTLLFRCVDTQGIVCLKGRHHNNVVLFLERFDNSAVTARFLSVSMTLICWINRFPEINTVREKENRIIKASKVTSDAI